MKKFLMLLAAAAFLSSCDEMIVPEEDVESITLDVEQITLCVGETTVLDVLVETSDSTLVPVTWKSDDQAVVSVDQDGRITAVAVGKTTVSAVAGELSASCSVSVSEPAKATADYVDEYGINHGKGTAVGLTVWAPVNCGYHAEDFKWGKLYQWGRKYGQGYSGEMYDIEGNILGDASDAVAPTYEDGGVSVAEGNDPANANVFYCVDFVDWASPSDDKLWNKGTLESPIKTEYDPCPEGWRVPTSAELMALGTNYSGVTMNSNGQNGIWFSGLFPYSNEASQVFLPLSGVGNSSATRNLRAHYWSSNMIGGFFEETYYAYSLAIFCFDGGNVQGYDLARSYGISVRCVQE